jgi:hypothetical protein
VKPHQQRRRLQIRLLNEIAAMRRRFHDARSCAVSYHEWSENGKGTPVQ